MAATRKSASRSKKTKNQRDAGADESGVKLFPFWKQLLAGFVLINIHMGIIFALVLFVNQVAAIVLAVLLGLAIIICGTLRWGAMLMLAGILAMGFGGGSAFYVHDYYQARTSEVVENASVRDVTPEQGKRIWLFQDGIVRGDLAGVYVEKVYCKATATYDHLYFYAAPIVTEGWREDMPVSLWAGARYKIPDSWSRKAAVGLSVNPLNIGSFTGAAEDAVKKHGLHGLKEGPFVFLNWVESYEKEVAVLKQTFKGMVCAANGAWFAGALIWALGRRFYR